MAEIVAVTQPRLRALARRIAGEDRAHDVVQASYLALTRRGELPTGAPLWAWLVTATVRIAYRHVAKDRRLRGRTMDDQYVASAAGPALQAERAETIDQTRAAIAGLPTHYRDVIVLHHLDGYRIKDVAALLAVPRQTVKTRLRRARALLRVRAPRRAFGLWPLLPGLASIELGRPLALIGGVMKTQAAVISLAVVLAAAGTGYLVGTQSADEGPVEARGAAPVESAQTPTLDGRLADAPREPPTGAAPDPAPAKPAPVSTSPTVDPRPALSPSEQLARMEEGAQQYADAMQLPEVVVEQAKALGVSDAVLRAMYKAEYLLHFAARSPGNELLQQAASSAARSLAANGEEGFHAVLANVIGNPGNYSPADELARATYAPGRETPLLEWMKTTTSRELLTAPLKALGGMDSPEVRTFLNQALDTYKHHASNFAAVARSLGRFADNTSAAAIGAKLSNGNWSGFRGTLLDALGRMGGSEAQAAIVKFIREPMNGNKFQALTALARISPSEARAEAKALLGRAEEAKLQANQVAELKRYLAQD